MRARACACACACATDSVEMLLHELQTTLQSGREELVELGGHVGQQGDAAEVVDGDGAREVLPQQTQHRVAGAEGAVGRDDLQKKAVSSRAEQKKSVCQSNGARAMAGAADAFP